MKIEKIKMFEIYIPVFEQYFYLNFWDIDLMRKLIKTKTWDEFTAWCKWLTTINWDEIFVYVNKKSNKNTLLHELIHVTYAILENKWIPENRDNEEVFAYLFTFLQKECNDLKNKISVDVDVNTWYTLKTYKKWK